jgi:hypothetical protein
MSALRLFLTYSQTGDRAALELARQLLLDLQAAGAQVVTPKDARAGQQFIRYLQGELPRCQYVLMVQTSYALTCPQLQTTIGMALQMCARHQLRGIWRLLAQPSLEMEEQPSWSPVRTIDASQNYAQARTRLLAELGLTAHKAHTHFL